MDLKSCYGDIPKQKESISPRGIRWTKPVVFGPSVSVLPLSEHYLCFARLISSGSLCDRQQQAVWMVQLCARYNAELIPSSKELADKWSKLKWKRKGPLFMVLYSYNKECSTVWPSWHCRDLSNLSTPTPSVSRCYKHSLQFKSKLW